MTTYNHKIDDCELIKDINLDNIIIEPSEKISLQLPIKNGNNSLQQDKQNIYNKKESLMKNLFNINT